MKLEQYIKIEQAKALYAHFRFVLIGTAGVSTLTVAVLWNNFPKQSLLLWLVLAFILIFARRIVSRQFLTRPINQDNYQKALAFFQGWAFITGFMWGLIPLFFFDADKPIYALFIIFVYSGYVATVASSTALYLPIFIAFSFTPTLMFSGRMFVEGGDIYTSVSGMLWFYYGITVMLARNTYKVFIQSKMINYKNIALLEQVNKQKEEIEVAINAKSQFLAAASHDLRQPLHAMGLFIDILKPTKLDPEQALIVDKIDQSKQDLNGLLHGLLDISRLDAGVVENMPINCSLMTLLAKLEVEFQLDADLKNLKLNFNLDHAPIIYIDAVLLERILRNVIDNSIKYTESGSVNIGYEVKGSMLELSLEDTGIGIDENDTEKVFSEFHQLNNPERNRLKGLGLGLAIVKRLCHLTGIKLDFESTPNIGTKFTFSIPLGEATDLKHVQKTKVSKPTDCKVVLIDDERKVLDATRRLLLSWGCKVIATEDLDQAKQQIHEKGFKPDIILADFRLREGRNGLDAIDALREEFNEEIPAILITGDTAPERLQAASNANVVTMYKPVEPDALASKLHSMS